MVLPLIGLAAAGVGGGILGSWLGGGKKEYHAEREHYAPVSAPVRTTSQVYAPTYQYQIDSPEARMTSKKDISATARGEGTVSTPRTEMMEPAGIDLTKVAIIGVIGLVAYGVVTKK